MDFILLILLFLGNDYLNRRSSDHFLNSWKKYKLMKESQTFKNRFLIEKMNDSFKIDFEFLYELLVSKNYTTTNYTKTHLNIGSISLLSKKYCETLLWSMKMYVDAICSDYSFEVIEGLPKLLPFIYECKQQQEEFIKLPVSNIEPLSPEALGFIIMPEIGVQFFDKEMRLLRKDFSYIGDLKDVNQLLEFENELLQKLGRKKQFSNCLQVN